jgi:hypothetical protein
MKAFLERDPVTDEERRIRAWWRRFERDDQAKLAEQFGAPTLRRVIAERKRAEADAARRLRGVRVTFVRRPPSARPGAAVLKAERERKETALQALRALLGNAELPDDVTTEATHVDLEQAAKSILQHLEDTDPAQAPNAYAAELRAEIRSRYRYFSPQQLVDEWTPVLRRIIADRKSAEAAAELQETSFRAVLELPYAGAAQLAGRCKDLQAMREALAEAITKTFDHWLNPPPPSPAPPPLRC